MLIEVVIAGSFMSAYIGKFTFFFLTSLRLKGVFFLSTYLC